MNAAEREEVLGIAIWSQINSVLAVGQYSCLSDFNKKCTTHLTDYMHYHPYFVNAMKMTVNILLGTNP